MSANVREFKVTGEAAQALVGGGRKRRGATTRRRQNGGEMAGSLGQVANQSLSSQIAVPETQQMTAQYQASVRTALNNFGPGRQLGGDLTAGTINLASSRAPTLPGAPPPTPVTSGVSVSQPAPVGGSRVLLAPPKRKTRVALKAKKGNTASGGARSGTRKARKIHLRVKGVTSRLAKAKKAKKAADRAPLSEVKARLEKAGVIKKGSKAPEPMLRTMYADLLITKKGL